MPPSLIPERIDHLPPEQLIALQLGEDVHHAHITPLVKLAD
jgi:hypothetical protein